MLDTDREVQRNSKKLEMRGSEQGGGRQNRE
jgi:hypothetical protein